MDIWRESGRVLAVPMPAPQKCADTPTQTHIRTPSYQLSRAASHPYFLLSDYLRARFCGERCLSWEFWSLLCFPSSLSAKGRRPGPKGWTALAERPPTDREDGTADKSDSGEHNRTSERKALFKEQSGPDRLPPSRLCVCMLGPVWLTCRLVWPCCLVPGPTAGLENLSKSHRLSSV